MAPKLATVAPYAAQLTALSKVPPQVFPSDARRDEEHEAMVTAELAKLHT